MLQQVEMVKAQQLALENHERSLEPILYLDFKGSAEEIDGDFDRFVLANQGEYCDEVNISYVRSDGEEVDMNIQPLHKGSERKFKLDAIYDPRTEFVVRYRKVSGKTGLQKFVLFCEFEQDSSYSFVKKLPL